MEGTILSISQWKIGKNLNFIQMKNIFIGAMLSLLAIFAVACNNTKNEKANDMCCKNAACCKNCDDQECKTTCLKVSEMNEEDLYTSEGKALVQKCKTLCAKNECCKDANSCEAHDKKDCCKK